MSTNETENMPYKCLACGQLIELREGYVKHCNQYFHPDCYQEMQIYGRLYIALKHCKE